MKRFRAMILGGMLLTLTVAQISATDKAEVDHAAPNFALPDISGNKYSLSDFKGKFVVLEWVNYDCPFVGKHYRSENMPKLQKTYREKDVVWLSICSSSPGKQGYFEIDELRERIEKEKAMPTAYLLDPDGEVGKIYDAKTTPHMYIINPDGMLIYAGGIDDIRSTDIDDIQKATNYVEEVLDAAMTGKEVPVKGSRPYGCSVKYK